MTEAITVSQTVGGEKGVEPVYNYDLTKTERDKIDCVMTKALGLCHEIDGYCPRKRLENSGGLSPKARKRVMAIIDNRHKQSQQW